MKQHGRVHAAAGPVVARRGSRGRAAAAAASDGSGGASPQRLLVSLLPFLASHGILGLLPSYCSRQALCLTSTLRPCQKALCLTFTLPPALGRRTCQLT